MKRVKIKKFVPKTVFKAVLFISTIPILLAIILSILGYTVGTPQNIAQSLLLTICYLAISPLAYGLVAMLLAAFYNWFAPRFGGLEIEIDDTEEEGVEIK